VLSQERTRDGDTSASKGEPLKLGIKVSATATRKPLAAVASGQLAGGAQRRGDNSPAVFEPGGVRLLQGLTGRP
jgi:hypothetical protein